MTHFVCFVISHFIGWERNVEELLAAGSIIIGGVTIAGQNPLSGQKTFDSDGTTSMDAAS